MEEEIIVIIVNKEEEELDRIDKYVSNKIDKFSRSQIKHMVENENVLVNDNVIKPNYKVKHEDNIKLLIKIENVDIESEDLKLNIVYEDDNLLVVYKPEGMVVHPAIGHYSGTLVNGLMHQVKNLSGINGKLRPGIVHRIDKDTSGLLMVAKDDVSHRSLVEQLVLKTVTRKYIAIVHGVIPNETGKINAPIGRDPSNRKLMSVVKNGKEAITNFKVLERFNEFTLIECKLETGRTHQIRVHMKYIDHPILGDNEYGRRKDKFEYGQFLHAKTVGFQHPVTNKYQEFTSDEPNYFKDMVEELKKEK